MRSPKALRVACLLVLPWSLPAQENPQTAPAATAAAEQSEEPGSRSDSGETEADGSTPAPAERRRIVDASQFPPRRNPVGGFFLAPFRALARPTERGLTWMEREHAIEKLRSLLGREVIPSEHHRHLHYRLRAGSAGDGSGFGLGARVSTAELLSENFELFTLAHYTTNKYLDTGAGLRFDPSGKRFRLLNIELGGGYQTRPQEDYFGSGPDSSQTLRSTYELQQREAVLTATVTPALGLSFGGGIRYLADSVFLGEDVDFPKTQDVFPPDELPGVAGAEFAAPFVFAEFDLRDSVARPRKGNLFRLSVAFHKTLSGGDLDFTQYRFENRTYLPLWTKRRVLAVRVLGEFNDPRGGNEVPFFFLARLGDSETLRGYDIFRFHGRHALAANIEYRFDLSGPLGAFVFTDVGQVFNRASELSSDNLRTTWGGGFSFAGKRRTVFRLYAGVSPEGTRRFIRLGSEF